jgi:hypothetical protein
MGQVLSIAYTLDTNCMFRDGSTMKTISFLILEPHNFGTNIIFVFYPCGVHPIA